MIEILTLFAGLVSGPQIVSLEVEEPVAAVETRLDGRRIGRLDREPWTLGLELGDGLLPHRLEAIARDAMGRELGRDQRWINVMTPARSPPSTTSPGVGQGVGLTPVTVVFEIPAGGGAPEVPAPEEMASWFLAGERPLTVRAVESPSPEVVIVLDPAVEPLLEQLLRLYVDLATEALADDRKRARESLREFASLGDAAAVRFLSPRSAPMSKSARPRQLFRRSERATEAGVIWLARAIPPQGAALRFVDAVAVAGH